MIMSRIQAPSDETTGNLVDRLLSGLPPEAVLVDLGVAMGPVIASIHEKRDEYREQIRENAALENKPRLRTSTAEG